MPVGHALSACFLEAVRSQLSDKPGDERDDHLAEALIRYDIVTTALRPLAEGIALYAEFDASPGTSRAAISPPLSDAFSLFGGSLPESLRSGGETMANALDFLLFQERLNGATPKRRETVLSQALVDDKDGYLTGYWLVKNWRLHLIDKLGSDALFDTDFYLQFIANYFYGDLDLANLIVDFDHYRIRDLAGVDEGQQDFANAFLLHFQKRLRHLVHDMQREDIDRMEAAFAGTSGYAYDDVQVVLPGHAEVRFDDYAKVIQSFGRRFVEVQPAELGAAMVHILNGRRWIAYASFETNVRLNEHNRFLLGEGEHDWNRVLPVIAGPVLTPGLKQGEARGVIELILDRNVGQGELRRLVWRGSERVSALEDLAVLFDPAAHLPVQSPNDPSLPKFSSASIRQILKGLTERIRAEFDDMTAAPIVAEHCMQQVMNIRSHVYGNHLALFVRKEGSPPTDAQLRTSFPALCENNIAALRIAASTGFIKGGMLPTTSDFLSPHQANALLNCSVELAFRRGPLICFRV
ncbi:MAG: hypothetical protein DVS81_17370 [Candidatus Accumulibacter meliphilus]|uniref:Uncharacterized protein n=1 Tax=Candidatus Accumulibacter meliphilus TaxID=2211374 RepID=A0A369XM59_9PROT|nr:MAG: hypothetical protein DVS81_17370 [Candidatus Accumulibacter meliphilus]